MVEFPSPKPTVLIVEDDPHGRSFMESSLKVSGFNVLVADSAESARELLKGHKIEEVFAVLSDYRLPGESGIDLLSWIRDQDDTVSTLIITGQGEKSIVEQSISIGVFDYLEKPVTHQTLRMIIVKAVKKTAQLRKYKSDRIGLQELEHLGQSMNINIPQPLQDRLQVFYRPLHEVGGDFLITHDYGKGRYVFLVGDISGHDIRSGFVSTYFQGFFKGGLESGTQIKKAVELSNLSLLSQSNNSGNNQDIISLALSAIDLGPKDDYILHWNFGFTPCITVDNSGRIQSCEYGRWPLGWMNEIDTEPESIPLRNRGLLYIFTDGLVEFAELLDINKFSLLFRFMREFNKFESLPIKPQDDILAIRYRLNVIMTADQIFEPILSEHYAGTEVDHIDHLQSNWRRSISFALQDRLGDRLYELLICIREGMINALTHGCESSSEKFAHLQISLNEEKDTIRVFIDDPGKGHSFDLEKRLVKPGRETGNNLGLGIVQHLSDNFSIENQGTSLVFDFQIKPGKQ